MSVIGFDIGNENSCIAAVKSGGIEILDNEYNLRSTPTYIGFKERCRVIGDAARSNVITNLDNTIFGLKRILGKKLEDSDFEKEQEYLPHEICKLPSGDIGIKVSYLKNNVVFSIEQLMAMMLTKLKMISEEKLSNSVCNCVIAVPVYYTDAQRRAMLDAVNIAGLDALKLINDSAAVALSYGFFKKDLSEEPQNVVFVDLGNSGLTVTACAFTNDKVKILGCVWDNIGGRDFDNKLVQHFVDDFRATYQLDVMASKRALFALMHECEKLKKVMSANSLEVNLHIECFMQDKDVSGQMKRQIFENLCADLFDRIEFTLRRILIETPLNNVHSVEIVGGSSRVPAVKQIIREVFGIEPNTTLNQDEAVARGCALQCALLSPLRKTRNFTVEDKPFYVIKIVWKNVKSEDEDVEVFSFSDKIPAYKIVTISMKKPFSLEARSADSYGNFQKIGIFTFENVPQEAESIGVMKISVKACLDMHGIFSLASAKMIGISAETEESRNGTKNESEEEIKSENPATENKESDKITQEVKLSSALKLYELTINSDVPGLSKTKLNEYIDAEQKMICTDTEEKNMADARNALEEYVYEARGKLCYDLYDFVFDNHRASLLQYLNETENWLYDNEERDASSYSKRLIEVKNSIWPIYKRHSEWKHRPAAIEEYQKTLQKAFPTITSFEGTEMSEDILNDVKNLRKMFQNSKRYLDLYIECVYKLNKYDDAPLSVENLNKSMFKFQTEFQNSYSDLITKIDSAKVAIGDGVSQEPRHSDQDTGPSMPIESENNSTHVEQQSMPSD